MLAARITKYTSENPTTCAGRAGSYAHEKQDAKSYCNWGVDYVKVSSFVLNHTKFLTHTNDTNL